MLADFELDIESVLPSQWKHLLGSPTSPRAHNGAFSQAPLNSKLRDRLLGLADGSASSGGTGQASTLIGHNSSGSGQACMLNPALAVLWAHKLDAVLGVLRLALEERARAADELQGTCRKVELLECNVDEVRRVIHGCCVRQHSVLCGRLGAESRMAWFISELQEEWIGTNNVAGCISQPCLYHVPPELAAFGSEQMRHAVPVNIGMQACTDCLVGLLVLSANVVKVHLLSLACAVLHCPPSVWVLQLKKLVATQEDVQTQLATQLAACQAEADAAAEAHTTQQGSLQQQLNEAQAAVSAMADELQVCGAASMCARGEERSVTPQFAGAVPAGSQQWQQSAVQRSAWAVDPARLGVR